MNERIIETCEITWSGIVIRISYEPNWLSMTDYLTAHLQLESIAPERAKLPVTETGYRSHFTTRDVIEEAGGPVAFTLAWLDAAALSPDWARSGRQLGLFD